MSQLISALKDKHSKHASKSDKDSKNDPKSDKKSKKEKAPQTVQAPEPEKVKGLPVELDNEWKLLEEFKESMKRFMSNVTDRKLM